MTGGLNSVRVHQAGAAMNCHTAVLSVRQMSNSTGNKPIIVRA